MADGSNKSFILNKFATKSSKFVIYDDLLFQPGIKWLCYYSVLYVTCTNVSIL